jgi:hypothetical protein
MLPAWMRDAARAEWRALREQLRHSQNVYETLEIEGIGPTADPNAFMQVRGTHTFLLRDGQVLASEVSSIDRSKTREREKEMYVYVYATVSVSAL